LVSKLKANFKKKNIFQGKVSFQKKKINFQVKASLKKKRNNEKRCMGEKNWGTFILKDNGDS